VQEQDFSFKHNGEETLSFRTPNYGLKRAYVDYEIVILHEPFQKNEFMF